MGQLYLNFDKKHCPSFKNPLSNWYTRLPRNKDKYILRLQFTLVVGVRASFSDDDDDSD